MRNAEASLCFPLTDEVQFDPGVPGGRLPEVHPAPVDAAVAPDQRLQHQARPDDGGAGLRAHPGVAELEAGSRPEGRPVAPVATAGHGGQRRGGGAVLVVVAGAVAAAVAPVAQIVAASPGGKTTVTSQYSQVSI